MTRLRWLALGILLGPFVVVFAPRAAAVTFDLIAGVVYRVTGDREWRP